MWVRGTETGYGSRPSDRIRVPLLAADTQLLGQIVSQFGPPAPSRLLGVTHGSQLYPLGTLGGFSGTPALLRVIGDHRQLPRGQIAVEPMAAQRIVTAG